MRKPTEGNRTFTGMKAWIGGQGALLLAGWLYFTQVPRPSFANNYHANASSSLGRSTKYLPLFGIFIGAVSGGIFLLCQFLFDSLALAAVLSVLTSFSLTRTSPISKSKSIPVGVPEITLLLLVFLVQIEALQVIGSTHIVAALVAAHAFSRFSAASFIFTHGYVETAKPHAFTSVAPGALPRGSFITLAFFGMVPVLFLGNFLLLCLLPVLWLIRTMLGLWLIRRSDTYTDDSFRILQPVMEACFYLALTVAINFALPFAN